MGQYAYIASSRTQTCGIYVAKCQIRYRYSMMYPTHCTCCADSKRKQNITKTAFKCTKCIALQYI